MAFDCRRQAERLAQKRLQEAQATWKALLRAMFTRLGLQNPEAGAGPSKGKARKTGKRKARSKDSRQDCHLLKDRTVIVWTLCTHSIIPCKRAGSDLCESSSAISLRGGGEIVGIELLDYSNVKYGMNSNMCNSTTAHLPHDGNGKRLV